MEIRGEYISTIYKSDNDFVIASYRTEDVLPKGKYNPSKGSHFFTVQGNDLPTVKKLPVLLTGEWEKSKKYPTESFKVKSFQWESNSEESTVRLLLALRLKGVGKSLATRIVKAFPQKALEVIEKEPLTLATLKGVSQKKAENISTEYKENIIINRMINFFAPYGILPVAVRNAIIKIGKERFKKFVENNCYGLCSYRGFPFKDVDKVALEKFNVKKDALNRIEAAIIYVLKLAEMQGHLFLPTKELAKETKKVLCNEVPFQRVLQALKELKEKNVLKGDFGNAYLTENYEAETETASKICSMIGENHKSDEQEIDCFIAAYETNNNIKLAEQQKEAVRQAVKKDFLVITGGPGTGKSTTLEAMLEAIKKSNSSISDQDILLLAPTGQAAKRMRETTKYKAFTIHSILQLRNDENDFEPFPLSKKVVVIDEMSMTTMSLFHKLMQCVEKETKVILVGDPDQLPAVGAGNVLYELCHCNDVPMVKLELVFRQNKTSLVAVNAHKMNKGERTLEYSKEEFQLFKETNAEKANEIIVGIYKQALKKGINTDDIQVICPLRIHRNSECCVDILNKELQAAANPPSPSKNEVKFANKIFRVNDKVVNTKNNNDLDIMNGDIGYLKAISSVKEDEESKCILFIDFGGNVIELPFTSENLENLDLAYCTTVHKSQGAEYRYIIMPVIPEHQFMNRRNLVYTGITRAKKKVFLIGNEQTIAAAIDKNDIAKRNTILGNRISEICQALNKSSNKREMKKAQLKITI